MQMLALYVEPCVQLKSYSFPLGLHSSLVLYLAITKQ